MRWSDIGFIVSKSLTKENSSIIKIFTKEHGCYPGIIYGSSSKKIKPNLELGNKVKISYNSRSEDALGYFSIELIENISIKLFNDNVKLNLLLASIEIISKVMPERQSYKDCFDEYDFFIKSLNNDSLKPYLVWEYNFLKNIGYGVDLSQDEYDKNLKNLLTKNNTDFTFNDLKLIYNLNTEIINNRLVEVINISNFKNRLKIHKYLNE